MVQMAPNSGFDIDSSDALLERQDSICDAYLIMQPAMPNDLYDLSEGCSTAQALHFLIDTLRGVKYLHSQGIIRRDIKPAYIGVGVGEKSTAALLDLGSFMYEVWCTQSVGTPLYLPPGIIALESKDWEVDQDSEDEYEKEQKVDQDIVNLNSPNSRNDCSLLTADKSSSLLA